MRNRYQRYEAAQDWHSQFRGPSPSDVFLDEVQNFAGYGTAGRAVAVRKHVEIAPPRILGDVAGQDLADVVADLGERIDALAEAGLGPIAATLEQLHTELDTIAGYCREMLHGYDGLYRIADERTGDLDEAQRENRDLVQQRSRLLADLDEAQAQLVTLRQEKAERKQLIKVLEEAEARGTIGRGTTARWVKAAHERA